MFKRLWLQAILGVVLSGVVMAQSAENNAFDEAIALYDKGDHPAALAAFEAIAAKRHPEGAYMAGLMHDRGRGTPVDAVKAIRFYGIAADQNFAPALCNIGILLRNGAPGVEANPTAAAEMLRRSAYLGNGPGQLALGAMQLNGDQIERNVVEGMAWMTIAAEGGNDIARDNLAKTAPTLDDATREAVRRQIDTFRHQMAQVRVLQQREQAAQATGTAGAAAGPVSVIGLRVEPAAGPEGKSVWKVISVDPGSEGAKLGYEAGDLLLSGEDQQGNAIDIRPEAGAAGLQKLLGMRSYKLKIHRPSYGADGGDPIVNMNVMRAG